jgi:hypothetical protein
MNREWYWAAGFLEGEGSFTNNRGYSRIGAGQKEREPLERLQRLLGGTIHLNNRELYVWNLSVDAATTMEALRPLMSTRRRDQIDQTLTATAEAAKERPGYGARNRRKTTCPNGHSYDGIRLNPDGSFRGRFCVRCRNARKRELYRKRNPR